MLNKTVTKLDLKDIISRRYFRNSYIEALSKVGIIKELLLCLPVFLSENYAKVLAKFIFSTAHFPDTTYIASKLIEKLYKNLHAKQINNKIQTNTQKTNTQKFPSFGFWCISHKSFGSCGGSGF